MKSTVSLVMRVMMLILFIFLINLWITFHLDNKVIHYVITDGILVLIPIGSFIIKFLTNKDNDQFKKMSRSALFLLLRPSTLIILYSLFIVIILFVSSVTVCSDGIPDRMKVSLIPIKQSIRDDQKATELYSTDGVLRFTRITTPFGRHFYLRVKGYARYSFNLYPLTGKRISVSKDLIFIPSIIIRVPVSNIMHLSMGNIVIKCNGNEIALIKTNKNNGSIMISSENMIPDEFIEKWKMELQVDSIGDDAATRIMSKWRLPIFVQPREDILPNSILEATFYIVKDRPLSKAKLIVGSEKIQDILLKGAEEE